MKYHLDHSWSHFFASCPENLNSTWGTQVVLFVMLAGVPPFHDDDDLELMKKVKKGPRPERVETMAHPLVFSIDCQGRAETKPWKFPVKLGKSLLFFFFLPEIPEMDPYCNQSVMTTTKWQLAILYYSHSPPVIGRYILRKWSFTPEKAWSKVSALGKEPGHPKKLGSKVEWKGSNFGWFE